MAGKKIFRSRTQIPQLHRVPFRRLSCRLREVPLRQGREGEGREGLRAGDANQGRRMIQGDAFQVKQHDAWSKTFLAFKDSHGNILLGRSPNE